MNTVPTTGPNALAKFEEGLRGVIGLLDNPNAEAAAIEQAVERMASLFDDLRASGGPGDVPSQTAGLNAIARQLAGRRLELVAEHLAVVRQLQLALDRSCEADNTGAYCDVER